jgi:hypothetical protein
MMQKSGLFGLALAAALVLSFPASAAMRCGWIANPTPGNWWLTDAQGTWVMMTQGQGEGAEGMDLIPDLTEGDWVVTNGSSYGYGCACADVTTRGENITRIRSFRQLPLSRCERDPALDSPSE